MLLNLQGIYKSYGGTIEVPVLKDVSIQVEEGEYVAIMGPSGSGKTTLMNIIGCLDRCTEGTYELDGTDISRISENELSEVRLKKIGFVFQTFELLPGETAIENVALPLVYAGVPKPEREKAAIEALTKVGLGERVNFKPNQLSGGQKQRVAIARALINHPRILLADEPTGALDSKSTDQLLEVFDRLNEAGQTLIMVTHSVKTAARAKRVLFIKDGVVFHELRKGNATTSEMFQKINDTLTLMQAGE